MQLFNFKTSASLLLLTVLSFISLSVLLNNIADPSPIFVNITFGLMGFLMALSVMYMGSMITAKWFEEQEEMSIDTSSEFFESTTTQKARVEQFA